MKKLVILLMVFSLNAPNLQAVFAQKTEEIFEKGDGSLAYYLSPHWNWVWHPEVPILERVIAIEKARIKRPLYRFKYLKRTGPAPYDPHSKK